jgi:hypothetical protein
MPSLRSNHSTQVNDQQFSHNNKLHTTQRHQLQCLAYALAAPEPEAWAEPAAEARFVGV